MACELNVNNNISSYPVGCSQCGYEKPENDTVLFDYDCIKSDDFELTEKEDSLKAQSGNYEARLQQAKDKQGFTGKVIDFFKGLFGFGSKKLDNELEQVKNGEMSEEEFLDDVEKYEESQKNLTAGFGNCSSGLVGAAVAAAIPGVGLGILAGALTGACTKLLVSFAGDEMSNNIEGDATLKRGLQEGATGALSGALGAAAKLGGDKLSANLKKPVYKIDPFTNCKYETIKSQTFKSGPKILQKIFADAPAAMFVGMGTGIVTGIVEPLIEEEEITRETIVTNTMQDIMPYGDLYVSD